MLKSAAAPPSGSSTRSVQQSVEFKASTRLVGNSGWISGLTAYRGNGILERMGQLYAIDVRRIEAYDTEGKVYSELDFLYYESALPLVSSTGRLSLYRSRMSLPNYL